jgi:hypothetical protein
MIRSLSLVLCAPFPAAPPVCTAVPAVDNPEGQKTPPAVRKLVETLHRGEQPLLSALEGLDEGGMQSKIKALQNLEYALQLEEEKQRKAGLLLTMYAEGE